VATRICHQTSAQASLAAAKTKPASFRLKITPKPVFDISEKGPQSFDKKVFMNNSLIYFAS
jgi:hypothetical protein